MRAIRSCRSELTEDSIGEGLILRQSKEELWRNGGRQICRPRRSQFIEPNVGGKSCLVAHVLLQEPFSGNEVRLSAIDGFLKLTFGSYKKFEQFAADAIGETVLS